LNGRPPFLGQFDTEHGGLELGIRPASKKHLSGEMSKPHKGPTRLDSPEPPCRFGRRVLHAVRVKVERWRRRYHRVREIENKVERERER
jgi:hypothetical protein